MKEKYRDFHFGEFIEKPNQCGYFEQNGNWYTYVIDERNFGSITKLMGFRIPHIINSAHINEF